MLLQRYNIRRSIWIRTNVYSPNKQTLQNNENLNIPPNKTDKNLDIQMNTWKVYLVTSTKLKMQIGLRNEL